MIEQLPAGIRQAIIVDSGGGFRAGFRFAERTGDSWIIRFSGRANLGKNGAGKTGEGDGKSPVGLFPLGIAFGTAPEPEGLKYPYRQLTPEDYWVNDSRSRFYNQWVKYREGDAREWNSAEWLWGERICYQYAVNIEYNPAREPGKGSAIFLHVWKDEASPTEGCVSVSRENMIRILQWLDGEKKPVIILEAPEALSE